MPATLLAIVLRRLKYIGNQRFPATDAADSIKQGGKFNCFLRCNFGLCNTIANNVATIASNVFVALVLSGVVFMMFLSARIISLSLMGFLLSASLPSFPAFAAELKTKDDLNAYLRKKLPANHLLTDTYEVGQKVSAHTRHGSCKTRKTIEQLPVPLRMLMREKLVNLKISKDAGAWGSMLAAACEYEITRFADLPNSAYNQMGIKVEAAEDFVGKVIIPLARQDFLGVEDVKLDGYHSSHGLKCDIVFTPFFRNYKPTVFSQRYSKELKADRRFKSVFSSEFKTGFWCFKLKYDGTYTWHRSSRL